MHFLKSAHQDFGERRASGHRPDPACHSPVKMSWEMTLPVASTKPAIITTIRESQTLFNFSHLPVVMLLVLLNLSMIESSLIRCTFGPMHLRSIGLCLFQTVIGGRPIAIYDLRKESGNAGFSSMSKVNPDLICSDTIVTSMAFPTVSSHRSCLKR